MLYRKKQMRGKIILKIFQINKIIYFKIYIYILLKICFD